MIRVKNNLLKQVKNSNKNEYKIHIEMSFTQNTWDPIFLIIFYYLIFCLVLKVFPRQFTFLWMIWQDCPTCQPLASPKLHFSFFTHKGEHIKLIIPTRETVLKICFLSHSRSLTVCSTSTSKSLFLHDKLTNAINLLGAVTVWWWPVCHLNQLCD